MTLLREGAVAHDDWTWLEVDDPRLYGAGGGAGGAGGDAAGAGDGARPLAGALIVPVAAWEAACAGAAPDARLGVHGRAEGADPGRIAKAAAHGAALVAIIFPGFADGRGFSLARQLRQAGFAGVLRAVGPLIPDQVHFAERVGFDEVWIPDEMAARTGPAHYAAARRAAVGRYQWGYAAGGADGPVSILAARHAAR